MIQRFRKVTPSLFRGSAPSPKDVAWLKDNLNIKKIISLDKLSGDKIARTTKLLNINHIVLPIELENFIPSLLNILKYDLKNLLLENGPTYIHCFAGKDRTGFVIALFKCKYMDKDPEEAIEEAKSLGFGIGVDLKFINIFEKLIRSCKKSKDTNNADIVSNEREYIGDNRDSYLHDAQQQSFAPYLSVTRQYPYDSVYNYINEQSSTRENYNSNKSIMQHKEEESVPLVGVYDNAAGIFGVGPVFPSGGFISE